VVEPEGPLPGGLYEFGAASIAELKRRGAQDAWRALEAAGWLTETTSGELTRGGGSAADPAAPRA
jgi:hypothetical protein